MVPALPSPSSIRLSVCLRREGERKDVDMDLPLRRVGHYYETHQILVVGDGDFSFSLSLAKGFGDATNMVCTSLDDEDNLKKKYQNALPNIQKLLGLGCTVMHGVDATKMRLLSDLRIRKFDRIIFNFPHAGFHGKEDDKKLIRMHRKLVSRFFLNAISLLRPYGEVHVSHKTTGPFKQWKLEDLAANSGLVLVDRVEFNTSDYPGYNHKRGSGTRSDHPFPLGQCSTFMFQIRSFLKAKVPISARKPEMDIVHGVHPELLQARYTPPRPDSLCRQLYHTSYEYPCRTIATSSYHALPSPTVPLASSYLSASSLKPPVTGSINYHQLNSSSYSSVGSLRLPFSECIDRRHLIPSSNLSVGFLRPRESKTIKHSQLIIPRHERQGYSGYLVDHGQALDDIFRDMYNGYGEHRYQEHCDRDNRFTELQQTLQKYSERFTDTFHYYYDAERDLQLQHRYQEHCDRDNRFTELQQTLQNWRVRCPATGFRSRNLQTRWQLNQDES
ncbi:unnamed protein product [Victoria cruziana]